MNTDKDNILNTATGRAGVAGAVAVAMGAALPGAAEAGVVVMDINPDVTLGGYSLDINGDTVPEFDFVGGLFDNRVNTFANSVVGYDVPGGPKPGSYAEALGAGEVIDGSRGYVMDDDVILSSKVLDYTPVGEFHDAGGAFIGLQFDLSGATHYGWMEVLADDGDITLRRYGYEDVANTAITTPQLLSVPEPSSLALLAAGAAGAPLLRRRRQQKTAR